MKLIKTLIPLALLSAVALPVFAQPAGTTTGSSATLNVSCVQNAVDKRDTALISAVDSLMSSWKAALSARKDALKAAWAVTDRTARRQALRDAWKAFMTAQKDAKKAYRSARMSAWSAYESDRKACGKDATRDDTKSRGVDTMSE